MIERHALRLSMDEKRPDGAAWARIAMDAMQNRLALLQDIGVIDRRIGTLLVQQPEDDQPVERLPSGAELARLFERTTVIESEVVSEAEKAWSYGDGARVQELAAAEEPRPHEIDPSSDRLSRRRRRLNGNGHEP
jgi:hypothetical protein